MSPVALLLLKLAAVGVPLAWLAWRNRIYPHGTLVLLAVIPAVLTIGLTVAPEMEPIVWTIDGMLAVVAAGDLLTLPRAGSLSAERSLGRIASLGKPHRVALTVSNRSRRGHFAWVRDDVPQQLEADPSEFLVELPPSSRATLNYALSSHGRGSFNLDAVHVRVRSRLGFWKRLLDFPVSSTVYVYPDMQQLSQYAVLARVDRLNLLGMRAARRIGQENEFERLRDYTIDDTYKHIDWRATARRRKLTVKDFQQNQSQRIVFLVDCGRMMTNQSQGLSFLDHAFNAMLMLSYVALRHGDAVGLMCFSDGIHRYVPPRGGMNQMNHLLHASFDQFPHLVESRYDKAFLYLAAKCRKRAMVILLTNVVDEVNGAQVEDYLSNLVGRHLPLGVLLRDRRLFELADQERPHGEDLFRAAAAAEILTWRQGVLADLEQKGVLALDVFPDDLTAPLINRYMDVKARQLL